MACYPFQSVSSQSGAGNSVLGASLPPGQRCRHRPSEVPRHPNLPPPCQNSEYFTAAIIERLKNLARALEVPGQDSDSAGPSRAHSPPHLNTDSITRSSERSFYSVPCTSEAGCHHYNIKEDESFILNQTGQDSLARAAPLDGADPDVLSLGMPLSEAEEAADAGILNNRDGQQDSQLTLDKADEFQGFRPNTPRQPSVLNEDEKVIVSKLVEITTAQGTEQQLAMLEKLLQISNAKATLEDLNEKISPVKTLRSLLDHWEKVPQGIKQFKQGGPISRRCIQTIINNLVVDPNELLSKLLTEYKQSISKEAMQKVQGFILDVVNKLVVMAIEQNQQAQLQLLQELLRSPHKEKLKVINAQMGQEPNLEQLLQHKDSIFSYLRAAATRRQQLIDSLDLKALLAELLKEYREHISKETMEEAQKLLQIQATRPQTSNA